MQEEMARRIAELMDNMECPKRFRCAESGFEELCKAGDIGLERYLVCLEENPPGCVFSLPWSRPKSFVWA